MILKKEVLIETDGNVAEEDEILVEVSKDEANKLFDLLFSSYSNARAALIREYTSNAWDAHKAIDSTEPVIIKIDEDDGGWFIEFIDKGVGMTEDFVKKVFSQLLKSTKNEDNSQIGGYGIGSKSGLGYTNQVLISTVKEGIKNSYLLYKDDSGNPKISPMGQEETEDHSGTNIKIYFDTEQEGRYSYEKEHNRFAELCGTELAYFDNVVLNFKSWEINKNAIEYNKGKIIEGKYFKYRTSSQYSNEFHLILGQVAYPIDWKVLGLNRIDIAVGVKFEIGELQVNMTREAIRYSDASKELIKERIELAKKELIDYYNKDNTPIESLFEFIRKRKQFQEEKKYYINFIIPQEISIENPQGLPNLYKLNVSHLKDQLNEIVYKPIAHLPIKLKDKILPYFSLYSNWRVEDGREKKNGVALSGIYNDNLLRIVFYKDKSIESKEFRKYIRNCYFVKQQKITNRVDYNNFKNLLGLDDLIVRNDRIYRLHTDLDGLQGSIVGISKIIHEYREIIKRELAKECDLWLDYDNFTIPEEWKIEQKRIAKETKVNKIKLEGKIHIKDILKETSYDLELKDLNNFKGFIVLGFKEDREDLQKLKIILKTKKYYNSEKSYDYRNHKTIEILTTPKEKICRVYQIAKNNIDHFLEKGLKVYHISEIMELKQIQRFLTSIQINSNPNLEMKQGEVKTFNKYIGELIKEVSEYYANNRSVTELVLRELVEKYNKKEEIEAIIDPIIKYKLDIINDYFKGAELARYVNIKEESLPHLVDYLKIKGKKVNINFYDNKSKVQVIEPERKSFDLGITLIEQKIPDLVNYYELKPEPVLN